MTNITLLGIDIAKSVFQLHGIDEKGNCVLKKRVKRELLLAEINKLPLTCVIAMEACATAHYWGRLFQQAGHPVKLIPPQYVKPFVKTNKNDMKDAQAITEAASRPSMSLVAVKTEQQQAVQAIHCRRSLLIKHQTAVANQIRGLLAEFGFCFSKKITVLKTKLQEFCNTELHPNLCNELKEMCQEAYDELFFLEKRIHEYDKKIKRVVKQHPACQAAMKLKGVGPISATMAWATIGDNPHLYKNGRQFSASTGLVPKQFSSGNIQKLGSISKRGNNYLRQLLIHGARNVVTNAHRENTPFNEWVTRLRERRGFNIAVVAVANKNARLIWATFANETQKVLEQQIHA